MRLMIFLRRACVLVLFAVAANVAAEEPISAEESQQYFFTLMQKAETFRIAPEDAGEWLHGVWRLERRAHVGGGHYVRSDRGDDVTLISNYERLLQIDFNHGHNGMVQVIADLADIRAEEDGSWNFGKTRRYIPLDDYHLAVADYDYVVVLRRISGDSDTAAPMPHY